MKPVITRPVRADDLQVGGTHYKDMTIEPWNVIDSWSREERLGFYRGNAVKYLMRAGSKEDAVQDLEKCKHYIDKLIETLS